MIIGPSIGFIRVFACVCVVVVKAACVCGEVCVGVGGGVPDGVCGGVCGVVCGEFCGGFCGDACVVVCSGVVCGVPGDSCGGIGCVCCVVGSFVDVVVAVVTSGVIVVDLYDCTFSVRFSDGFFSIGYGKFEYVFDLTVLSTEFSFSMVGFSTSLFSAFILGLNIIIFGEWNPFIKGLVSGGL